MKKELIIVAGAMLSALALTAAGAEASCLKNGSFEEFKNEKPLAWSFNKFASVISKEDNSHVLKFDHGGRVSQILNNRALWQKPEPRKIQVSLQASGKGKLIVEFYNYSDTPDKSAKTGYKRKFLPTRTAAEFALEAEKKLFSANIPFRPMSGQLWL